MTKEEFGKGWAHFCKCINFAQSALDAEAIRFMNEAPREIAEALEVETNPYILTGDELKRTEEKAKKH